MADLSGIDLLAIAGRYTTLSKKATTNGGEYEGPCPFCGGTDRFLVWPTPKDKDRGSFWCRQCEKNGDALTLVMERENLSFQDACRFLGVTLDQLPSNDTRRAATRPLKPVQELPRPPDDPQRKQPTAIKVTSFETLATSHGLTLNDLKKWGFGKTSRRNRSAVVFPTPTGSRWRFLDGEKPKYDSIPNYQRCWYGLDRRTVPEGWSTAIDIASRQQTPLILCNGELSTIKGLKSGLAAFALAGGESGEFTAEQIGDLRAAWQGSIFVVLDGDVGGWKSGMKRAMQLQREGFTVEVLDLGGLDGYDLADFCMDASGPAYIALLKCNRVEIPVPLPAAPELVSYAREWQAQGVTLARLRTTEFTPMRWVIDGLLPEGCCLLAGKPKSKKSWLALDVALACATGEKALGQLEVTSPGTVLYLDLESNQRRMKSRVANKRGQDSEWPANFHLYTEWPKGDEAIAQLDDWMALNPDTRLIVIDVFKQVRPPTDKNKSPYDADYEDIQKLNAFSERHRVTVMVIHHTRKAKADDVFDEISGSTGLTGGTATMWIIGRVDGSSNESVLNIRGRDVDDDSLALRWDDFSCTHILEGDAAIYAQSKERQQVIDLMELGIRYRPAELASLLGKPVSSIQQLLRRLMDNNLVAKVGYGQYERLPLRHASYDQSDQSDQSV